MNNPICFGLGFIAGLALTVATVLVVEILQLTDILTFL
jgi:hypothetical protein